VTTSELELERGVSLQQPADPWPDAQAVVVDMPEAQYHALPGASSSILRLLLPPSVPALARHAMLNPKTSAAFDLGSVTHRLTLGAGPPLVEIKAPTWQSPRVRALRDQARERGELALLTHELDQARAMADAVLAHPDAAAVLRLLPGAPERILLWRQDEVRCRAMLDRWPSPDVAHVPVIGDLKTAYDVTRRGLARAVWDHRLDLQRHHYRLGYYAVHGVWPEFLFVFVRKEPPHLVRVVDLGPRWDEPAAVDHGIALDLWRRCSEADDWPEYPAGVTTLDPPRWVGRGEYL
jgi:hypothetical protein